eukprot:TRINITY_DN54476_c0_g1_i1.p1 TRINITY_DN54476_c0_g1~~TRINITY_DN54476_c0_g1_i1.p1  ORF type:complete len:359 (+),score=61.89 TRINITY_DN54476_c0_g1_i1:103-1077(+)
MPREGSDRHTTEVVMNVEVTALCCSVERSVEAALEKSDGRPEDVVVVLDLDETCFTANTQNSLATSSWFEDMMQRWLPILQSEAGMSRTAVLLECLELVDCFYPLVPARITEEGLPSLLESLKHRNIATIGLTARRPDLAEATWQQLGDGCPLVFDSLSPPWDSTSVNELENYLRSNGYAAPDNPESWEGIRQDRGVWFTANANKGAMLRQTLKAGTHVIFADDSERHLHDAKAALDGHAASVCLLHYTAAKDAAKGQLDAASCDRDLAGHCAALFDQKHSGFMALVQRKQPFLRVFIDRQLELLAAAETPQDVSLRSLAASLQ